MQGPVLVAVERDAAGDEALRQAGALAAHLGAALEVVQVLPELHHARVLFPQLHRRDAADLKAFEQQVGDSVAAHVVAVTGRSRADFRVLLERGSAHAGLLRQAEHSGAGVVVAAPGPSVVQVVRHARCPVLVARPGRGRCVLGATDLSDPALPALHMAAEEARRRGLGLAVVHALDLMSVMAPAGMDVMLPLPLPTAEDKRQVREAVIKELRAALEAMGAAGETVAAEGPAARVVVDTARDLGAELLVIGTRGRTGLARLALGSVAEALIQEAPCSVLVVRLGEAH